MTAFPEPADIEQVFGQPALECPRIEQPCAPTAGPWRVVDTDGSVRASRLEPPESGSEPKAPEGEFSARECSTGAPRPRDGCSKAGATTKHSEHRRLSQPVENLSPGRSDRGAPEVAALGTKAASGGPETAPTSPAILPEQLTNVSAESRQAGCPTSPIDMPRPDSQLKLDQRASPSGHYASSAGPQQKAVEQPRRVERRSSSASAACHAEQSPPAPGGSHLADEADHAELKAALSRSAALLSRSSPRAGTSPETRAGQTPSSAAGLHASASQCPTRETDPALARVVERWSALPRGVRAAVVAMVEAGTDA